MRTRNFWISSSISPFKTGTETSKLKYETAKQTKKRYTRSTNRSALAGHAFDSMAYKLGLSTCMYDIAVTSTEFKMLDQIVVRWLDKLLTLQ